MKQFTSIFVTLLFFALRCEAHIQIGAYYFDGWSGKLNSTAVWAKNAPTHLTDKLYFKFPQREPIWGWRDDDVKIMEQQIDWAADNGIDFFMFCWYFADNKSRLNTKRLESFAINTSLQLFLKARNKSRMHFAIMIANHTGYEIIGKEQWTATMNYLAEHYFKDSQYLKVDGKPVVEFFSPQQPHTCIQDIRQTVKSQGYQDLCFFSCTKFYPDADINGWYNIREKETGKSEERSYKDLTKYVEKCWYWKPHKENIVPIVMAGWDMRPWEAKESTLYYTHRSPKLFYKHIEQAVRCVQQSKPKIPLIMIYAWNELGEGGYLVPCKDDPKGKYLKQIKKVRSKYGL